MLPAFIIVHQIALVFVILIRSKKHELFQAGGVVGSNGRLQGRLEVSRAFGDRQFKKV